MNTRPLFALGLVASLLAAACAPAATPQVIGGAPRLNEGAAPTASAWNPPIEAPAATQVPGTAPQYLAAEPTTASEAPLPELNGGDGNTGGYWVTPAPTQPSGTTFVDPGFNPFVDTREDHLSTFAIDVDTASYTVARNYIQSGQLPPTDAVRVEEFVNYFNQGYSQPEGVAFGLFADAAPSPYQTDGTVIVRFGVQGYSVPTYARKPASLTFVVDVSGSMADGGRMNLVHRSLQLLLDQLRANDTVAIIAYTDTAWVALNPTSAADRYAIEGVISSLQPLQSTNVAAGLQLGYETATYTYRSDRINRVILLSDGVANVGATSPDAMLESVRRQRDLGITLTTVGVGMGNYNDVLLEQLANDGDGNYMYIDDENEARAQFVRDVTSNLQVIARDAKIQVDFNSDTVQSFRQIGYENRAVADSDFRNDAVDAGEIGAGHTVTALYAVRLRSGAQGRIATLQLRWQEPDTGLVREANGNVNTYDIATSFEATAPRYQLAVSAAHYAELLRNSPYADPWTWRDLARRVSQIALVDDPDVYEFSQLVQTAARLSGR
ncbi:MAG TPA: von Willebrand factor type A domain-containing protein [Anaerolineales bacterium]|nr:von Willebrand factor type A domain-containing protein [Anaerolineales bacterium]HRF47908.1 von Willebrand factor type A domain-containing protein [Anaerolineales bacterium]